MNGLLARLRRVRGLLAACLLAVFVAVPLFDAVVCGSDVEAATPTAHQVAADSHADRGDHGSADRPDLDCQHGHCHHNAPILAGPALIEPVTMRAARLARTAEPPTPPSQPPSGPDRPPRA